MANEETLEQLEEILEEAEAIVQKRELKIDLSVDEKRALETMKDLEDAFCDLKKNFENISSGICKALKDITPNVKSASAEMKKEFEKAFTITNSEEYEAAAARFGEGVAGALMTANENVSALEDSIVNTTAPVAGAVASILNELLPPVIGVVNSLKQTIGDAITGVQPLVTWLWDGFLQPIAQWTGGVIIETLQSLAGGLTDISNWIQNNKALVEGIVLVVGSAAAAIGLVNTATSLWHVLCATGTVLTGAFGTAMAVLGIHIGDADIYRAADRYRRKMAVVNGRPY